MIVVAGLVVVIVSIGLGYFMEGGVFAVLMQPAAAVIKILVMTSSSVTSLRLRTHR